MGGACTRCAALFLACVALLAVVPAAAGQLETLTQQLQDRDFKVRLSAGLKLGQLGDPRAIPALLAALGDEVGTVRTIAASALAKLVDRKVEATQRRRALEALRTVAARDREAGARRAASEAVAALERVERIARPRPVRGAIFVDVEELTDASGAVDTKLLAALTDAGRDALLEANASYLVEWPGGKAPSRRTLKKSRAKAVAVLGTVTEMTVKPSGKRAAIACKLSLVVATYPERAARAFVDGRAQLDASNSPAAIERAKSRCTLDLVRHLMGTKLPPDISATAR